MDIQKIKYDNKIKEDILKNISLETKLENELENERFYSASLFNFLYENDLIGAFLEKHVPDKIKEAEAIDNILKQNNTESTLELFAGYGEHGGNYSLQWNIPDLEHPEHFGILLFENETLFNSYFGVAKIPEIPKEIIDFVKFMKNLSKQKQK